MIRLHSYFRSSASYRVRIALALKGIDHELVTVNLRDSEHRRDGYRDANPEGLVPMLEDGDLRISQSMAILEYLEERFPAPALLPADAAARARVRALCQMIACDIHPLNNLRVLQYLIGPMQVSRPNKDLWYAHWIQAGLAAFEQRLQEPPTGHFCHGDAPTLADCFLVPQLINARLMQVDCSDMPLVQAIGDRCLAMPAFAATNPMGSQEP
jgi:maleylacetoacetate isomerase/maleylpyruvate isomerase